MFFREGDAVAGEMRVAVKQFAQPHQPHPPYDRYEHSFVALLADQFQAPRILADTAADVRLQRMSTLIYLALLVRPDIFSNDILSAEFAEDLAASQRIGRSFDTAAVVFQKRVAVWLWRGGIALPRAEQLRFAKWLRKRPRIAPTCHLIAEIYDVMASNQAYRPKRSDMWDFAHMRLLPYVSAMTLDKHKIEVIRQVSSRLRRYDGTIDYDQRVYGNLGELLRNIAS